MLNEERAESGETNYDDSGAGFHPLPIQVPNKVDGVLSWNTEAGYLGDCGRDDDG